MNLATTAAVAASNLQGMASKQSENWKTTMSQCDSNVPTEHWICAVLFPPCVAAQAKSTMDQSNPVFNFCCFTPLGSYSYVRNGYNIQGECGRDCMNGGLCFPCGARRIYTETSLRQQIPGRYGQTSQTWNSQLGDCNDCGEFVKALFCPCLVSHDIRKIMQVHSNHWFDWFCIIPTSMYGQVRNTYGIGSSWPHPTCEDIVVGALLYPCALNRALKEATYQKTVAASTAAAGFVGGVQAKVDQFKTDALSKIGKLGQRAPPPAPGEMH